MIYARVHVHDPEQVTSGTGHRLVVIGEASGGALVDGCTRRWWLDHRTPHFEMTGLMLYEFHIHEICKKKKKNCLHTTALRTAVSQTRTARRPTHPGTKRSSSHAGRPPSEDGRGVLGQGGLVSLCRGVERVRCGSLCLDLRRNRGNQNSGGLWRGMSQWGRVPCVGVGP